MPHIPGHSTTEQLFEDAIQPPRRTTEQLFQDAVGIGPEAEAFIARQGAAPEGLIEGARQGIDAVGLLGRAGRAIKNVPLPGGIGTPGSILEGLNVFERQVVEPITATGTVVQAPSVLGAAGVPGFQGDFQFNPEQLPGRSGFREEFRENVPLGARILAEGAFDPLNVVPGVGFTKFPRRVARGIAQEAPAIARALPSPNVPVPPINPRQGPGPRFAGAPPAQQVALHPTTGEPVTSASIQKLEGELVVKELELQKAVDTFGERNFGLFRVGHRTFARWLRIN